MRSCSVRASRTCPQAGFYLDHDVTVAKGCIREYVESKLTQSSRTSTPAAPWHRPPAFHWDGTGSHRLLIVGLAGTFTGPDGFPGNALND